MAKKFLIVVAGIVAVMAALVFLPGVPTQNGEVDIEYQRQEFYGLDGQHVGGDRETLHISNDSSAKYARLDSQGAVLEQKTFSVSSDDMKVLSELFLNTGFMQIPASAYEKRDDVSNFTAYQLVVTSADEFKSIRWVNVEAGVENIPAIVVNAGTRLDAIIEKQS
jgi:hypothetical protein